jgi:hypothetical protein
MTRLVRDSDTEVVQTFALGASQTVAIGVTSAASTAFGTETLVVRLYADQDCFVEIGASPTASSADAFLPSGVIVYHGCEPGDKVAVIQDTTAGTLYITEAA